ncbi:unnamed protein product, partial [Allacma fusca]
TPSGNRKSQSLLPSYQVGIETVVQNTDDAPFENPQNMLRTLKAALPKRPTVGVKAGVDCIHP